jgi:hypothetical protein
VAQAREARWLANSPSVTPMQRVAILTRIRVEAGERSDSTR